MTLSAQLYLVTGLAALALGAGALFRAPRRSRNQAFALLTCALTVWCLGAAVHASGAVQGGAPLRRVFLLGGLLSGPLALNLARVLVGARARWPAFLAALLALAFWATDFTALGQSRLTWGLAAAFVVGLPLGAALGLVGRRAFSLPAGAERSAFRWLLAGGIVGALGGTSDFLPRAWIGAQLLGAPAVMIFLLIVSAVVLRHRFLDVGPVLARGVALFLAAGAALVLSYPWRDLFGPGPVSLFVGFLALLALAGPATRVLSREAQRVFGGENDAAQALLAASQRLAGARGREEVWRALEKGAGALPEGAFVRARLESDPPGAYRLAFHTGCGTPHAETLSAETPLARALARESTPLVRRALEESASAGDATDAEREVLAALEEGDTALATPLLIRGRLIGWVELAGTHAPALATPEIAAALAALGAQAFEVLQRIEAEERARRHETLAALGSMAGGLAHEVRNPVAAMRGASQVIRGGASDEQTREMLAVIEEEGERLSSVVGDFLDFARPAAPQPQPVDLRSLIESVIAGMEAAGLGLRTTLHADEALPMVWADPAQLARVLANLARNAREAAGPEGRLDVSLALGDDDMLLVRLQDDGPGIRPEDMDGLFRPFVTTKKRGSGLGLALSHRIVEAHGGEIRVEGRPGLGAAFTLRLPRAKPAEKGDGGS